MAHLRLAVVPLNVSKVRDHRLRVANIVEVRLVNRLLGGACLLEERAHLVLLVGRCLLLVSDVLHGALRRRASIQWAQKIRERQAR